MAEAPLKYIDIQDALRNLGNKSLAMSILPGQGQIPGASPEFMAGPKNPFPNALPMPMEAMTMQSLAGTLGQMGQQGFVRPGQESIADRQQRGFFADLMNKRMQQVNN